jgi:hypothetical protein
MNPMTENLIATSKEASNSIEISTSSNDPVNRYAVAMLISVAYPCIEL